MESEGRIHECDGVHCGVTIGVSTEAGEALDYKVAHTDVHREACRASDCSGVSDALAAIDVRIIGQGCLAQTYDEKSDTESKHNHG